MQCALVATAFSNGLGSSFYSNFWMPCRLVPVPSTAQHRIIFCKQLRFYRCISVTSRLSIILQNCISFMTFFPHDTKDCCSPCAMPHKCNMDKKFRGKFELPHFFLFNALRWQPKNAAPAERNRELSNSSS